MRVAGRLALSVAASLAAISAAMGAEPDRAASAPPGALSCSGCHAGHTGRSETLPRLTGRPAAETVTALAGFRSGERPSTLMGRIAKGFTDEESRAIAVWLEGQR